MESYITVEQVEDAYMEAMETGTGRFVPHGGGHYDAVTIRVVDGNVSVYRRGVEIPVGHESGYGALNSMLVRCCIPHDECKIELADCKRYFWWELLFHDDGSITAI